jgi:predicted nuclease with TOPRIM domain
MRWLLALLAAVFAAAGTLTDHFTSPPVEVLVIRTDQWLFCQDYGVTIQIKALDPVTVKEVRVTAKFYPEGTWNPQVLPPKTFGGFSLQKGEIKQLVVSFNYCPQRQVDPLILLEIQIALPNYTLSYNYYIGRVLPTTYEDLARYAASLEQRVKELTALVDQLKKQVADLQARVANLTALLAAARTDNEKLSAVLAQVRAERDALRAQLDQVQAQLSAVSQAKAAVEAQLADAKKQLEELKVSYDKLSGQYTDAQRTIADLQARLSELQRRYDELQKAEQQLRESYFSLSAKYSELSGRYDELSKSYQQAQQEKALLQSRYSELNTGFTWAVNMATALGMALLFVIALFLTRKRYAAPPSPATQTPPATVKTAVVLQQQEPREALVRWPATAE